jgi:hypothetical protein
VNAFLCKPNGLVDLSSLEKIKLISRYIFRKNILYVEKNYLRDNYICVVVEADRVELIKGLGVARFWNEGYKGIIEWGQNLPYGLRAFNSFE